MKDPSNSARNCLIKIFLVKRYFFKKSSRLVILRSLFVKGKSEIAKSSEILFDLDGLNFPSLSSELF